MLDVKLRVSDEVVTTAMTPVIELRDVACGYDGVPILHGVDLTIHAGQLVGLVGPSGAGKTTLLRVLLGQIAVQRGDVCVLGRPVSGRPPTDVGYVPQLETINWSFPVTVEEVVLMGRAATSGPWPWPSKQDREALEAVLERLGLRQFARRHIRELSGGQQQRVFLARALLRGSRLLLLDEPTTGVDIKTRHDILHLLRELNRSGVTIVMTTHDLNSVATHLPYVVCLNHTVVAQGSPDAVFTPETLSETYGAEMIVLRQNGLIVVAERLTADRTPAEEHASLLPVG
jgi:zinc/manganese transport system ATP-binding protein/zinc transport system ATP-binding protein